MAFHLEGGIPLTQSLEALIAGESDALANLCNAAALLYHSMEGLNWAGFYLYKEGQLVLGPFQGKPACIRIPLGKGVCGTAAARRETLVVKDVHLFPGHIACDEASASEIVVPLVKDGRLLGVLDVDSPIKGRFGQAERESLEAFAGTLLAQIDWEGLLP